MRRHKNIWKFLTQALAASRPDKDLQRMQKLGAIGISDRGKIFRSRNCSIHAIECKMPAYHAEARLSKKLPPGSKVFVARYLKSSGIGIAKPCSYCQAALKNAKVKTVYYTIDSNTFGVMTL